MSRQAILPFVPTLPLTTQSDSAVESSIRRALLRKEPILLGMDGLGMDGLGMAGLGIAGVDPYSVTSPVDPGFVRSLLQALTRLDGLEVAIRTRSPRVLQDLSLLTELDQRHAVRVDVPISAVSRNLARRIEPGEPDPEARLWAVAQLAAEGIATRVLATPLVPGVNDGENALRDLFEAALEAGACDVATDSAPLAPPARPAKIRLLSWGARAPREERTSEDVLSRLRQLRLEHGFPRPVFGRG